MGRNEFGIFMIKKSPHLSKREQAYFEKLLKKFLIFRCTFLYFCLMKTILVDIGNASNLQAFLNAVANLDFIKSVRLAKSEDTEDERLSANEPETAYNWTNPSRPASDKEIEQLIDKMENSSGEFSTDEVRNQMKEWAAQKSK